VDETGKYENIYAGSGTLVVPYSRSACRAYTRSICSRCEYGSYSGSETLPMDTIFCMQHPFVACLSLRVRKIGKKTPPSTILASSRGVRACPLVVRIAHSRRSRRCAGPSDTLEQLLNLRCAAHELVCPEVVPRIFDQLDKRDEQSPWMWAIHDEPFQ
jgi:hypothetical protein